MNRLAQHRPTVWLVSATFTIVALAMHLALPVRFAGCALGLLVLAYLLAWFGIFLHTDAKASGAPEA